MTIQESASVEDEEQTISGTVSVSNFPSTYTVVQPTASLLNVTIGNSTLAVTQSGTWNIGTLSTITNVVHVDDNSSSLTIDGSISNTGFITTDITKTATIESVQATASGNTTVHTTTNGKSLRLKQFFIFNSGTANITVSLKDSTSGTARFQAILSANTGFGFNLIGCNWQLTQNNNLVVSLSATGTIDVTILGEEV